MDILLLLKIPCILLVTTGFHLGFSQPNPPPSGSCSSVPSSADKLVRIMLTAGTLSYLKTCLWSSALAESAVIIARTSPSHPVSRIILENLLFGGSGKQIQFTTEAATGIAFGIVGSALRAWCYRELGKYFTFEMCIMKDHSLVKTGPYEIVRHPSYTATFLINVAIYLLHATRGSWVRESGLLNHLPGRIITGIFVSMLAIGPLGVMKRMKDEDAALRMRFGVEWDAWASKVRYMMIPGVF